MVSATITRAIIRLAPSLPLALWLTGCATTSTPPLAGPTRNQIIVSVRDQKLTVITADHQRVTFPISTSKFGLGDRRNSLATPTGELEVAQKVGDGAPPGSVFHGRVRTGEVVKVDQPGRDAIVTRILALKGLEASNKEAYSRGIYIHGTPEERNIGRPVSYGCIRMRSKDVIQLYDMVKVGARVEIIDDTMNRAIASNIVEPSPMPVPATGTSPATVVAKAQAHANMPPPRPHPSAAGAPSVAGSASVKPPPDGAASVAKTKTATTTTTTTTLAGAAKPGAAKATTVASKTDAKKTPPAKKEWAGTPAKLLAKQAAIEAKAKNQKQPPADASRPVSNEGDSSRDLGRNALDSL
jgi:hypothetical protein